MTDTEQWRPIPGFSRYEASNLGQIRNIQTLRAISRNARSRTGYPLIFLRPDGERLRKTVNIASAVAATWLGPRPKGFQIDHKDGNKLNDAATNLEYVSQSENIQRSFDNGQHPYRPGPLRFLTEQQYAGIKALWRTGKFSQVEISKMFGTNNSTICKIVNGKINYRATRILARYQDMKPGRMREIAELRGKGMAKKAIARQMGLSTNTVRKYVKEIEGGAA